MKVKGKVHMSRYCIIFFLLLVLPIITSCQQDKSKQVKHPQVTEYELINAIRENDIDTVKKIIDSGQISIDKVYTVPYPPIIEAIVYNRKDIISLLLEQGADPDVVEPNNGETPVMVSIKKGYTDLTRMLIENGALINNKSFLGNTPLLYSVCGKDKELVSYLLVKGSDPSIKNHLGRNALMNTANCGYENLEVFKVLLRQKLNLNEQDKNGETTLMLAAKNGHKQIVEFLLEHNVDIALKNEDGQTAEDISKEYNHFDIVEMIRSKR